MSYIQPPLPFTPLRGGIGALSGFPNAPLARGLTPPPFIPGMAGPGIPMGPIGSTGLAGQVAAPTATAFNPATYVGPMGGLPTGLTGAAEAASGGGGLLSRLPSFNPAGRPMTGAGGLARSVAGRGTLGLMAGQLGSGLIDKTNVGGQNSNLEQGLQGASIGAGVGAAVGAPLFGIGAVPGGLIGAGVGGAIGVLSNMFGGGGDEKQETNPVQVLATAMQAANLTPEASEQILNIYETQMALAEGIEDDAAKEAAQGMALEQTGQMILQVMQQQQAAVKQAPQDASRALALQQQAQQVFQPLADDIRSSAGLYAQAVAGMRDNVPESYRAVLDTTVARELSSADKLANAYMAQAQLTPIMQQMTRYQQDQDAFAQQLFSQALAQQASAMGQQTGLLAPAGGGSTANDLMAQLTG